VVSLHLYANLLPVVMLCRALGCKTVATLHIPLRDWGLRHRMYWRVATSQATVVAGVSRLIVDEFHKPNTYPVPLPGGVSQRFFDCERAAVPAPGGVFRIIAIGRLNMQKDWPTLIAAVGALPQAELARVQIDSYGTGPLRESLQEQAQQDGVHMVFHGYVEKQELALALHDADLSVLPSRFEGLGLSALEGMAAGVPTITADFPASADFIEAGVTGHTFPIGNAEALGQLILWHMRAPAQSRQMGETGREFIGRHFSEEVAYAPYITLFDKVAASYKVAPA
jgi:glycosyltransferase involved in cell wall biosynthesis